MGCKIYTKLQKSAAAGGVWTRGGNLRGSWSSGPPPSLAARTSLVLQGVDVGADLERRPQFDVHAGHQVVLGEQQQRLAVDLLQAEVLGHVAAAWKVETEHTHLKCC